MMRLDSEGCLEKQLSDTADQLTFFSIPYKYAYRKRFLRAIRKVRKVGVLVWYREAKKDKARIRRYWAQIRAIEQLIALWRKLHKQAGGEYVEYDDR